MCHFCEWVCLAVNHLMMCLSVGGIVSGDELMAVNGKILLDASLSEGQNSLTRAWNSGGVGLRFLIRSKCLLELVILSLMCAFSMCKLKPMFLPLGLDWCGDCCFPSKGIWRRSVSIPHNEITAQMSILYVIPMHIWSISVPLTEATVWQCGLWVSLCACVCSPKSASVSPTLNRAVFEGSATLYRHGYLLQH